MSKAQGELRMSNLTPLNDWMIVEEIEEEQISAGGIVLPEKKKLLIKKGKVLSISDDIAPKLREKAKDLKFEIGDVVLFHTQVGIAVDISDRDNKEFFMKYESVMGKVTEE